MRRPSPLVDHDDTVQMESAMTPMIDVVFLLLVFFVWTASFQIVEQILPSEMSSQMGSETPLPVEPPPEMDFDNVVIRVALQQDQPTWWLNDVPVGSLDELRAQLAAIAGVNTAAPVILHPDPAVPMGAVIRTYDAAKLSGFAKVSFAVNPQTTP